MQFLWGDECLAAHLWKRFDDLQAALDSILLITAALLFVREMELHDTLADTIRLSCKSIYI